MNTVLRLSLGLLLMASMVGCNTCGQQSCMHKAFNNGGGCGCHDGGGCDMDAGATCDCGHKRAPRIKHRHTKSKMLPDAVAHGYDNSVVYTGEDYQGIPQQPVAMMSTPHSSGCSGGPSLSTMPSVGTMPSHSGCSGCSGGSISAPPVQSSGCSSCGGGVPQQMTSPIPSSGGCASCGGNAGHESFYSPMSSPNNNGPAPAPPAEAIPGHNENSPGDKAVNQGESIQKINWVPRQL
ncbi:MAG: hypothetical protein NT013_27985 [Planctomycetia bacterium]|nr:hypothetical protein [Planctomycetia bacterium]